MKTTLRRSFAAWFSKNPRLQSRRSTAQKSRRFVRRQQRNHSSRSQRQMVPVRDRVAEKVFQALLSA